MATDPRAGTSSPSAPEVDRSRRSFLGAALGVALGGGRIVAPPATPAGPMSARARRPGLPVRQYWRRREIGTSRGGRPIDLLTNTAPEATVRLFVGSAIHGDEPLTYPFARAMMGVAIPDHVSVWLVPLANPDGWARGARENGSGVDLNRNFPWTWRRSDGGPSPASEPETVALMHAVVDCDPTLAVWVHQPLGYVGAVGATDPALALPWLQAAGVEERPGVTQHGGAESWCHHALGIPTLLVEIDTSDTNLALAERHLAGYAALLASL